MTVTFRIESVRLDTTNGPLEYAFPGDLTVLAGQTGVGKTTLLELVKFGLGGDGQLFPVSKQHVVDVHVSIRVGALRLQLSRRLDHAQQRVVRVLDLISDERLPDHSVAGEEPVISDLLLTAMGVETQLRAAARGGRSTSAGAQITFNDVYRFMYIPQSEMNRDIASSQQGYYDPKRKAVFELLFAITSAELLQMRSEINTLRSDIEIASRQAAIVQQFLMDAGITARFDAEIKLAQSRETESSARAMLASLQSELADAVDRESKVLRDLLADAEISVGDARDLVSELRRQGDEYETERRRVAQDVTRIARIASAGLRLASIEFSICPRCTQRLDRRSVPEGSCPVCLLDDVVAGVQLGDQYETEQLSQQIVEIEQQIVLIQDQERATASALVDREALVASLSAALDARTATRVTPRLQAFADAVALSERAQAEQAALDQVLRQWDRAEDLAAAAETLISQRGRLQLEVAAMEQNLGVRKAEIFDELDAEFLLTVMDFGIPSIETASISRDTYLPLLNGSPFTEVSSGGGIITATQVAYWISLVTVAARRRDTHVPAFLLLDSPRLALNAEDDIAGQMYRRFSTQVAATPGRLQFIVADNELPSIQPGTFGEIRFSYESPTVSTIEHPGPAQVGPSVEDE